VSLNVITIPAPVQPPQGLVVVLHGWGANAADVEFLVSLLALKTCQCLLPDGPFPHPYSSGRMWYDLPQTYTFATNLGDHADLLTSRRLLTDWLQSLANTTGVPLSRTILGGFSQGGAMTLDVGLTLPLAGLMVLSGYSHAPIAPPPQPIAPILLIHGRQDPVVPLAAAQHTRDRLLSLGATIQYEEFDMGHEIAPIVLNRMQRFVQAKLQLIET
jgi:phospholipase/carboxylesterase